MEYISKFVTDSGFVGYLIVLAAIIAGAMIIERAKVLYGTYAIKTDEFIGQIKALVMNNKIEEAATFASANQQAPLARAMKIILERADRDRESMAQGLDIAVSEIFPKLTKRLGYLSMLANVATLMGLLGTIQGLILAFEGVSFADPSQKQVVLAQGISLAMNTTFLGLAVAIPIMIAFAFLNARQNEIFESIAEQGSKIIDLLGSRHYQSFSASKAFPRDMNADKVSGRGKIQPPPMKTGS